MRNHAQQRENQAATLNEPNGIYREYAEASFYNAVDALFSDYEVTVKIEPKMSEPKSIEYLFQNGVLAMNIGRPPQNAPGQPNLFISANHAVPTGEIGNNAQIIHQAVGDTIDACLDQLITNVNAANVALRKDPSGLVPPPR